MPEYAGAPIIVLDPSPIVREGLIGCLSRGSYVNFEQADTVVGAYRGSDGNIPRLALIGPGFTESDALAQCREALERWPGVEIILITDDTGDPLLLVDAAHTGCSACLSPNLPERDLLEAVADVLAGTNCFRARFCYQPSLPST